MNTVFLLLIAGAAAASIDPMIVHIVPHSYNPEFFKKLDDYFPWRQTDLLEDHLGKVFDQVILALNEDPDRTFTHYEVKYFSQWY